MRLPWKKVPAAQLDLLEAQLDAASELPRPASTANASSTSESLEVAHRASAAIVGLPPCIPIGLIDEDPNNPRTEFPESEVDELAEDIRQHGILQPLVVHLIDADGRYRLHFGAKRLRAAVRAGLQEVPVVVRHAPADPYTQVAENQKRHGLSPLDLARFIRGRVEAGDSNATIAKQLGMNLTTVAHHLSLLELPPVLDHALKSGRCTSPRTLHELSRLHEAEPDRVHALVNGDAEITRGAVAAMKTGQVEPAAAPKASAQADAVARANAACDRLERALAQIRRGAEFTVASPDVVALRIRVEDLARCWLLGSDRQTPSRANH